MKNKLLAFIVGFPRSGTTLLRVMMTCHDRLCVPPESRFILKIHNKLKKGINTKDDINKLIEILKKDTEFPEWNINWNDIKQKLLENLPLSITDTSLILYQFYLDKVNKSDAYIVDKNPAYIYCIPVIKKYFPDTKFIHILRDGRAAFLSNRKESLKGGRQSSNAIALALRWNKAVKCGNKFLNDKNYMEIKYEDLIFNTEEILKKICLFIDIEYKKQMLKYYEVNKEQDFIPAVEKEFHKLTYRNVDPERINAWKKVGKDIYMNIFNFISRKYLRLKGYEPLPENMKISTKLLLFFMIPYLYATFFKKIGFENFFFVKKILYNVASDPAK